MDIVAALALSVFPALVIAAALSDVATMTIPNKISAALIVAFFPAALAVGLPMEAVLSGVGVGLAALVIGAVMFALRWVGGGDAKLIAAAGLWLGVAGIGPFLMWTAVAGGCFALSLIMLRNVAHPYAAYAPRWIGRLLQPRGDIPYGVAIAIGALAAFPSGPMLHGFSGLF